MLQYIDVFNGDADGICALHQLRLAEPRPDAQLVTGVKRDILLLQQVAGALDAQITVLDISFDRNRNEVEQLLKQGNTITYIDHHFSGDLPSSPDLTTHIDPAPETCTSLIVDQVVGNAFTPWAIAGAFGDNLDEVATQKGKILCLSEKEIGKLRTIGQMLNYNGYGMSVEDLHFPPALLYQEVHQHSDPFAFFDTSETLAQLIEGYRADMERALQLVPIKDTKVATVYLLPRATWARRVVGVFSNQKAREFKGKAHATLLVNDDGSYRVSVRAPLSNRSGADILCRKFPTGGGRAAAAGINRLPADMLNHFLATFTAFFQEASSQG